MEGAGVESLPNPVCVFDADTGDDAGEFAVEPAGTGWLLQLLHVPLHCSCPSVACLCQVELLKVLHLCVALGLCPAGGLLRYAKFLNECHFGQQQDGVGVASGRQGALLLQRIAHLSSTLLPLLSGWGRLGGAGAGADSDALHSDHQLKVRVL